MKLQVNEEKLKIIHDSARENFVPILQDDSMQFIEVMLEMIKPHKILEVGTAVGYSASMFAKHLEIDDSESSYITTIERNDKRFEEANKNILDLGLEKYVHIAFADATEYLASIKEESIYDVVFIDAAKGQYVKFLNEAKRLVKSGGVIIADNVLFKGRVLGEYTEHRNRTAVNRLREYIKDITEDKMLTSTVVNIGDGVAVSIVNKSNA